jgi:hypothetical protein
MHKPNGGLRGITIRDQTARPMLRLWFGAEGHNDDHIFTFGLEPELRPARLDKTPAGVKGALIEIRPPPGVFQSGG